MQLVNKNPSLHLFPLIFAVTCFLVGTIYWFTGINQQNLNPDEVMWVGLTEFYTYRQDQQWHRFQTIQPEARVGYGSQANLATDQPQMGKYLFGFVLDVTNKNPWQKVDISWVYTDFSTASIPNDQLPDQQQHYLGEPLIRAIEVLRTFNSIIGFLCLLLFVYLVQVYSKNIFVTSVTFLLTTFNPLFLNYFRKTMMDSPSALMIFVSGILIWVGIEKIFKKKSMAFPMMFLGGISVAIATSLKINGFFLLALPLWLTIVQLITKKLLNQDIFYRLILSFTLFLTGFSLMFLFLEPITWNSPLDGTYALLRSRLQQQDRFFIGFGKTNYLFMPAFALFVFFSQFQLILLIPSFITLALGFIKLFIDISERKIQEIKLLTVLLFIFAVNFYYARTGFDRYLIPTVFSLLFIQSIGFQFIFEKCRHYAYPQT